MPNNAKELRSFLGLANFYRRFVQNFAEIAAPLTELTSNKLPYTWTTKHQQAFKTLHKALTSPPVLDYPKQSDQFVLSTDASDAGIGAIRTSDQAGHGS